MKQSIMLLGAMLLCSSSLVYASSTLNNALQSALKNHHATHLKADKNEIAMVYGGADISRKPTLIMHTATT